MEKERNKLAIPLARHQTVFFKRWHQPRLCGFWWHGSEASAATQFPCACWLHRSLHVTWVLQFQDFMQLLANNQKQNQRAPAAKKKFTVSKITLDYARVLRNKQISSNFVWKWSISKMVNVVRMWCSQISGMRPSLQPQFATVPSRNCKGVCVMEIQD